jgi:hypothetical protein
MRELYFTKPWTLETKEDSPHTNQSSFITLKTMDGELSLEYE